MSVQKIQQLTLLSDCVLPSVAAVEECVTECDNIKNEQDIKSDVEKSPVD